MCIRDSASTGSSLNEGVSSGLWELNDVTRNMNKELQAVQVHVNVRSVGGPIAPSAALRCVGLGAPGSYHFEPSVGRHEENFTSWNFSSTAESLS